ncbi:MAG: hypothetical protein ACRYFS_18810 [Janthinobacterium lividum]
MTRIQFPDTRFLRLAAAMALIFGAALSPIPAGAQAISIPNPITSAGLQTMIDNAGPNSVFSFSQGTYTGLSFAPLSGDTFIGAGGVNSTTQTIFDGGGASNPFIQSYSSQRTNVTLQHLVVQHYYPQGDTNVNDSAVWAGPGWVLTDVCIDWCGEDGVNLYATAQMNGGEVKNCGHRGIGFSGTLPKANDSNYNGAIVNGVEIAYNNTQQINETGSTADAAGLKGGAVDGVVVAYCSVHDNHGVGIWADVGCSGWFIHDNCVKNNDQDGITYEISHGGSIYNNLATNNGGSSGGAGQILIANSDTTNAYLNIVVAGANQNAIVLRSDGSLSGVPMLANDGLRGNNVTFSSNGGFYGLIAYNGRGNLGTGSYSYDNNFHLNQGANPADFSWGLYNGSSYLSQQAYQQTGQDPSPPSSFGVY